MYHAQLGRFCSRDPLKYHGGSNLLGYAGNRPNSVIDPRGREWAFPQQKDAERWFGISTPSARTETDDRGVTQRYCDSWRESGETNKWTQCACQVSRTIDALIAGLLANAILGRLGYEGMDSEEAIAKVKWFRCTRSCLVRRWQDADDSYFGRNPERPPTPAWQEFLDNCAGKKCATKQCCRIQVKAEQSELSNCMNECGRWNWGNPSGEIEMPGWDPNWDFNDLKTRIDFGNWRCCGDKHPDGKTSDNDLIKW